MGSGLVRIFQTLNRFFGDLHWWPGETPFEVAVGDAPVPSFFEITMAPEALRFAFGVAAIFFR